MANSLIPGQTLFPGNFYSNHSVSGHTNEAKTAIEVHHLLTDKVVRFKAFITTFSDDHQSTWNEQTVYGRMDPMVTFERTSRSIQIEFDVPSYDIDEAKSNFYNLTLLKQFLYPLYEKNSNFSNALAISSSPLVRVRFMNYIVNAQDPNKGLLGGLKGIQFAPNYEVGTYLGTDGIIVPKLFKVTLSFTVLHEHTTGWVKHETEDKKENKYIFGNSSGELNYPYNNIQQTSINSVQASTAESDVKKANMNALLAANSDVI
jgi:hypothetical protein